MSIPGRGRAKPDRSRGWKRLSRETDRTEVTQSAVRALVIVLASEVFDHDTGFGQSPQLFPVQAFVAEAAVKRLDETVLLGTAWIDVDRFDVVGGQPVLDLFGDELRPVV